MRKLLFILLILGAGTPWVLHAKTDSPAQALYQKGLDAYLQGDYDQAILMSAKSIQLDPGYKPAQDLLSVLVVEKDRADQTEIWLTQKQRPAVESQSADDHEAIWKEIEALKMKVSTLAGPKQMTAFESRLSSLVQVMRKSVESDNEETRAVQGQMVEKLNQMTSRQRGLNRSLFWLLVLVAISLACSIWALFRKPQEKQRQLVGEQVGRSPVPATPTYSASTPEENTSASPQE